MKTTLIRLFIYFKNMHLWSPKTLFSVHPVQFMGSQTNCQLMKTHQLNQQFPLTEIPNKLVKRLFRMFRSEEHTSELQSRENLVCRLLLEKKNSQGCWIFAAPCSSCLYITFLLTQTATTAISTLSLHDALPI